MAMTRDAGVNPTAICAECGDPIGWNRWTAEGDEIADGYMSAKAADAVGVNECQRCYLDWATRTGREAY